MKIVLTPHEVNNIIVKYLTLKGTLSEATDTNVTWFVDRDNIAKSYIEVEQ